MKMFYIVISVLFFGIWLGVAIGSIGRSYEGDIYTWKSVLNIGIFMFSFWMFGFWVGRGDQK